MRIEPENIRYGDDNDGVEIRVNICTEVGDQIVMHAHARGHMTLFWRGKWRGIIDGVERIFASVSLGGGLTESRLWIPAGAQHAFKVMELEGGVAVMECNWHDRIVRK